MEMMSLPRDLIMECIARVPRWEYPTVSLVCKMFRSIVASPETYTKRSLLGSSECYIYVCMLNLPTNIRWYVLDRKIPGRRTTNNCLVPIPSLPLMALQSGLAVVGSTMYVMGARGSKYESSMFLIDCPSNTWRLSGNMPRPPLVTPQAGIVDGKIYVVGGGGRIMVFDTEKQTWEELAMSPDMEMGKYIHCCVAMSGKIYFLTSKNSFVYEPKEGKWETDEVLNSKDWLHASVIDDEFLCYYDAYWEKLRAYDPKDKSWKVVNGLEGLEEGSWSWSCVTRHCRKLVLFLQKRASMEERKEIWGAEIALERRQGGEVWGRFEWCNVVLSEYDDYLEDCRAVTI